MNTSISLHDRVYIPFGKLSIVIKDLEKLAAQEPTDAVKKKMTELHCREVDAREIGVLYCFSANYCWAYRVTDYSNHAKDSEGMRRLGFSEYLPETLESVKNLIQE